MINNFSQFLFNQFRKNEMHLHELNYLFWECTLRCNLQCRHCGSDCKNVSTVKDMLFEDFLNAILPLKEKFKSDSITVAITGGEPLLREDLPQCGIQLRKNGFLWGIVTNGYGYTPEVHSKLLSAGMGTITVSLDGLESSHNWLRANDQSFKRAVNALSLISSSSRLNFDVVTCVNKKNIDELDKLKDILNDMQIKAWRLFIISPIGRAARTYGSIYNDDLYLTNMQLKQLMDFIVMARNEKRINVSLCCGDYVGEYERKVRDAYYICRAGMHIGSILIDGSISACPNINRSFIQGNIYQDNFLDVWNNKFEIMRNRKWSKIGLCKDCEAFKNCNGGPMHLWDENKDTIMACTYQQLKKC